MGLHHFLNQKFLLLQHVFFLILCVFASPLEMIHLALSLGHLLVGGILLVCDYSEVILGWVRMEGSRRSCSCLGKEKSHSDMLGPNLGFPKKCGIFILAIKKTNSTFFACYVLCIIAFCWLFYWSVIFSEKVHECYIYRDELYKLSTPASPTPPPGNSGTGTLEILLVPLSCH